MLRLSINVVLACKYIVYWTIQKEMF